MIDQNEIVMEAGRLDDVEAVCIVIAVAAYTQDVLVVVSLSACCHLGPNILILCPRLS